MTTIGVTGYARTGKDTVAHRLVSHWDFKRYSLADGVREALLALNPWIVWEAYDTSSAPPETQAERLHTLVSRHGWEDIKANAVLNTDLREQLQRMGTEVGRNLLGPDVWINRLETRLDADYEWPQRINADVVIPDVRFDNEAEFCDYVIEVTRPGVGPANGHASEVPVKRNLVDYSIDNNRGIEDLNLLVDDIMRQIRTHEEGWRL